MVEFVTNKEDRVDPTEQLMVGSAAGITVTTRTIKVGGYESFAAIAYHISPGVVERVSPLTEERPSIDIDRETGEIPIVILQYEDGFTVYPLDIDGVVSQGESVPEALDNVKKAISLHLEAFGTDVLPPKNDRAIKVFLAKTRLLKQETKNA